MGKKLGSGPGMNNPDVISRSLETIFVFKYSNSLMRIREGKIFGSGIRDKHPGSATLRNQYKQTSGVWPRVRARALRSPVFFGLINMPNRALRVPPAFAASLILIYPPKLFLRPELGPPGVHISIHWAKLHPSELHCIY